MRDWKHSPKTSSSVTFFSNTISVGKIAQISKRKTHSAELCAFFKSFGMKRSVWPLPTSFLPNNVEKKMRALELRPIWGVIWVRYGISFAYIYEASPLERTWFFCSFNDAGLRIYCYSLMTYYGNVVRYVDMVGEFWITQKWGCVKNRITVTPAKEKLF